MKKILFTSAVFVFCIFMVGCAKMPQKSDYIELHAAPDLVADENSGVVFFLREKAFIGGGVSYFIQEDLNTIGVLRSGSYFGHKTTLGIHTYWAETEAKVNLTLDIQPNSYYYIVGGIGMGALIGRPTLSEVTDPSARVMFPSLRYTRLRTLEEQDRYKILEDEAEKHRGM